jgi:hypothetical protein
LALRLRLPDAEDRNQARSPRAKNLVVHHRVAFAVTVATLGMPEDDMAATGIGQHFGTDVAGIRTLWRGMAILSAEGDAAAGDHVTHCLQQARRRANEKLASGPAASRRNAQLRKAARQSRAVFAQPVHFPIAGDKFCPNRHVATPRARLYLWPRSHRHAGGSTCLGRQNRGHLPPCSKRFAPGLDPSSSRVYSFS